MVYEPEAARRRAAFDAKVTAREVASAMAWRLRDTPHYGAVHDWAASLPSAGPAPWDPFAGRDPRDVHYETTLAYQHTFFVEVYVVSYPPLPKALLEEWRREVESRFGLLRRASDGLYGSPMEAMPVGW